ACRADRVHDAAFRLCCARRSYGFCPPVVVIEGQRRNPSDDLCSGTARMRRLPQIALLPDGKRLHLQDGPIDLIIEASGREAEIRAAYDAAARRFDGLLDELCAELPE